MLDLYVDGALPAEDAAAFEAELRVNPDLRSELDAQREIDDHIRRTFAPPATTVFEVPPPAAIPIAGKQGGFGKMVFWTAASVLLVAAAGVFFATVFKYEGTVPLGSGSEVYAKAVATSFKPDWVCKDDQEFASATNYRLREPLVMAPAEGVRALGWVYATTYDITPISDETMFLLVQVGPDKAIVLVDRAENDRRVRAGDGLSVYRSEVGDLVLYEITPLNHPAVLNLLKPAPAEIREKLGLPPAPSNG